MPLQITIPAKGGNQEYSATAVEAFIKRLGHERVRIRTDGEPSIKLLATSVQAERLKAGIQTIVEETPRYSSQSLGAVGVAQRIVQGRTRTARSQLETDYRQTVGRRMLHGRG